jgi:dihydroflavonol-4-reductase
MRALVTGISGFIGSHLARRLLDEGVEVVGLARNTSRLSHLPTDQMRIVQGDLGDPDCLRRAVQGVDIVYHLAGVTKVLRPQQFMQVNARGTAQVVAACTQRTSPPVLVMVSSLAAAGPSSDDRPRTERDPLAPVSNYGRSKLAGERFARAAAGRLPVTIVRPPIVIGVGDSNLNEYVESIQKLGLYVVPTLHDYRFSLIDVQDLVPGIILAGQRGRRLLPAGQNDEEQSGVYFLADDEHPTYAGLGRMIGAALHCNRIRVLHMPWWLAWMIAGASEFASRVRGQPSLFNSDKVREATAGSWTCSPKRAQTELGFHVAASLEARLRNVGAAYLHSERSVA